MNKGKIYYKLVNKGLESWIASGILKTKYKVGEKVFAKKELLKLGYGLTVFKDFGSLKEFGEAIIGINPSSNKIYACKIGKVLKKPPYRLNYVEALSIKGFKLQIKATKWPDGTVMTDSIELIEEVTL